MYKFPQAPSFENITFDTMLTLFCCLSMWTISFCLLNDFEIQTNCLNSKTDYCSAFLRSFLENPLARQLSPKRLGKGQLNPTVVFSKMCLLKRGWNTGFLWLLILSEVTPFLKISLKILKLFRRYQDFLRQY